jgi:hypothetical protein
MLKEMNFIDTHATTNQGDVRGNMMQPCIYQNGDKKNVNVCEESKEMNQKGIITMQKKLTSKKR